MTSQTEQSGEMNDPDGSIFLTKDPHPDRVYERMRLALLMNRGFARDLEAGQKIDILDWLERGRNSRIGHIAIETA